MTCLKCCVGSTTIILLIEYIYRAWQDPGAWVIKPIQGEPNSCMVTCLSNIDFKVGICHIWVIDTIEMNKLNCSKKYGISLSKIFFGNNYFYNMFVILLKRGVNSLRFIENRLEID